MTWRASIRALADVDWSPRPHIFTIIGLVIASRPPFLNVGFGWGDDISCDPDSKVMLESNLIQDFDKGIIVAYVLTQPQVEAFISDGRTAYYLPEWEYLTIDGQGFSLAEEGRIQLDL